MRCTFGFPGWLTVALACGVVAGACTCSKENAPQAPSASAQGSVTAPLAVASSSSSAAPADWCPDPEVAGWRKWIDDKTGMSLFVAPSAAAFPKGLTWEDTPADRWLDVPCKKSVLASGKGDSAERALGSVSSKGESSLAFIRKCSDFNLLIFTDLEGKVKTALAERRTADMNSFLNLDSVADGYWVGRLQRSNRHSVFGGPLGTGDPVVLLHKKLAEKEYLYVSTDAKQALLVNPPTLLSWTGGQGVLIHPGTSWMNSPAAFEQFVFYRPRSPGDSVDKQDKLFVWDSQGGRRPLMGYTRMSIEALSTDGKHFAWVVSSGAGHMLAASPFATTRAGLQPRRYMALANDKHATAVGCGYALVGMPSGKAHIVKIADGQTWTIKEKGGGTLPIGITCEEVVLLADSYSTHGFARVRLDSLGSPTTNKPLPLPLLTQAELEAEGEPDAGSASSAAPSSTAAPSASTP